MRHVLEPAVALAIADDIGKSRFTNRQRCRRPDCPVVNVAHVDHLARPIAHRIVAPGRQLVLLTVNGPRVTSTFDGCLEAERGVGDDVDPGRWRALRRPQDGHVFASSAWSLEKPPRPLKKVLRSGRAGSAVGGTLHVPFGPQSRRLNRGTEGSDSSRRRFTCSKRLPRRLKSTARAAHWSRRPRRDREEFGT